MPKRPYYKRKGANPPGRPESPPVVPTKRPAHYQIKIWFGDKEVLRKDNVAGANFVQVLADALQDLLRNHRWIYFDAQDFIRVTMTREHTKKKGAGREGESETTEALDLPVPEEHGPGREGYVQGDRVEAGGVHDDGRGEADAVVLREPEHRGPGLGIVSFVEHWVNAGPEERQRLLNLAADRKAAREGTR